MNNLAYGYYAAGKLDLALPLWEETLEKMKVKLGLDHPLTLTRMNNLRQRVSGRREARPAVAASRRDAGEVEGEARPRPPRHPRRDR